MRVSPYLTVSKACILLLVLFVFLVQPYKNVQNFWNNVWGVFVLINNCAQTTFAWINNSSAPPLFGVLEQSFGHWPYYSLVVVILSSSVFCFFRCFLYYFIAGDIGSSSNITSFSASAICSVDFAGRNLLISGVNPLGGGGGGIP